MKGSDFLQILESFPGRMEMKRTASIEFLVLEHCYIDFKPINMAMRRPRFFVDIPNNEEMWFKFLSFLVISAEYGEPISFSKQFLKSASQKRAERICNRFNEHLYNSRNIIQDIAQIKPEDLIAFAKSGAELL